LAPQLAPAQSATSAQSIEPSQSVSTPSLQSVSALSEAVHGQLPTPAQFGSAQSTSASQSLSSPSPHVVSGVSAGEQAAQVWVAVSHVPLGQWAASKH
jgi:hypothetical protein